MPSGSNLEHHQGYSQPPRPGRPTSPGGFGIVPSVESEDSDSDEPEDSDSEESEAGESEDDSGVGAL